MVMGGGQQKNSGSARMGTDSGNTGRTSRDMDKRRRQGDSARKTGLDSVLQEVLTVVETGDGGDNKKTRDHQKSGRYFCIWTCQNKMQRPRYWGNIVEVSPDRLYAVGMLRFHG